MNKTIDLLEQDCSKMSDTKISNKLIQNVGAKLICRSEILHKFALCVGQTPYDSPSGCVYLHGDTGTGKSAIVETYLKMGSFKYAVVSGIEFYSISNAFEKILNQLTKFSVRKDNNYKSYYKCGDVSEFISGLQQASQEFNIGKWTPKSPSIILVLDRSEEIRNYNKTMFSVFCKLREVTQLKLGVVFISTLPFQNICSFETSVQPITIYVPQYSSQEIATILALEKPPGTSEQVYKNFIDLFLSLFYSVCKDLDELKFQTKLHFKHYIKPVLTEGVSEEDCSTLWKKCQPQFKVGLETLYSRVQDLEEYMNNTTQTLKVELPFYTKFVLISAYIASYNPASTDKRLFAKNHGKHKNTLKDFTTHENNHMIGPKSFVINRLFAILQVIVEDIKFRVTADLYSSVSSLVKMNFLAQVGNDSFDEGTFKCLVDLQFITLVAKTVQCPILNYLTDFQCVQKR